MSYLERQQNLPEELRSQLGMLRRNVQTEARLVDDLLDITRISRGKLKLHLEVVDLHDAPFDFGSDRHFLEPVESADGLDRPPHGMQGNRCHGDGDSLRVALAQ